MTGSQEISRTFIHSLSRATPVATSNFASIYGILINAGSATYSNNIINIGTGVSLGGHIYGIYDPGIAGNNNNFYYNTIYIGGVSVQTGSDSYAFMSNASANNKNIRNNIFFNNRTGPAYHSAIRLEGNGGVTVDYNDYYNSTGLIGRIGLAAPISMFNWQAAIGQDANSLSLDPVFVNGSLDAVEYIPAAALPGIDGTGGITQDYGFISRIVPVTMGAWENDCNGTATISPTSILECENETVSFTVALTNVTTPAFAWEESTDGGNNWTPLTDTPPYSGTTSATLTITGITIAMHNNLYRCVVTDSGNSCVYYSDVALLEVNAAPATGPIWHQ
jgi:hypothetical protein